MFRGRYEHTMDAKGRTSLPARYRDVLVAAGESRIVITSSLEACLVAYGMREWLAGVARWKRRPPGGDVSAQVLSPAEMRAWLAAGRLTAADLGPPAAPAGRGW